MSLEKELQSFAYELQNTFEQYGPQIQQTLGGLHDKCFVSAGSNSDKYASCMREATKRLLKEQSRLELKNTFFQMKLGECLTANGADSEKGKKCKQDAVNNMKSSFKDFFDAISK